MIIDKNFTKYVVYAEDSLSTALKKMSGNKLRNIIVVSQHGFVHGVLSDGDIRRWLTSESSVDVSVSVSEVTNYEFVHASINDDKDTIRYKLNNRISMIPLLDRNKRLSAVALKQKEIIDIDGKEISHDSPTFVIAEIGNNHNGDILQAKLLVDEMIKSGVDCVKFQLRDIEKLYVNSGDSNDPKEDLGSQYTLDLLSRFQLKDEELFDVFDYCTLKGVIPLCTPWDSSSLEKLESYGMVAYKVASADFTNHDLLQKIAKTNKPMLCSTGMSTEQEIREGIDYLNNIGAQYVLLHCNSSYPAPLKDVNLKYMKRLKKLGDCHVGYSGHERGITIPIAAVALGAKVIEKHVTLDKTLEGSDHRVSLLPEEFKSMVKGIRQVEEAIGNSNDRVLSRGEVMNRESLAKSLVASIDINKNEIINESMVSIGSPGQGMQPNLLHSIIGKKILRKKAKGELYFLSDFENEMIKARSFAFDMKWGIPVRYHDLHALKELSNMDLFEIHLSYKDMELDFREFIKEPLDYDFVVHAPELFSGDHTLDLCTKDEVYRKRSVLELQRVINLTRELAKYFTKAKRPCIVTNVGGFSSDSHMDPRHRQEYYNILEVTLKELNTEGVELIIQTMPPYPWHFGGQQFHNLFMDSESIVDFCERNKMRVCFDISHSKLACNHYGWDFDVFVKKVMPYTAHLHIADSEGVDGEGLQIDEGDINWEDFSKNIYSYNSSVSFIPEIWQGHKNDAIETWRALDRLESYYLKTKRNESKN